MKKFILTLLLSTSVTLVNGQQSTSPPQTTPIPTTGSQSSSSYPDNNRRGVQFPRDNESERKRILFQNVQSVYRKPGDKEKKLLEVDPALLNEYRSFLNGSDTGIIRLLPNFECVQNMRAASSNVCRQFTMPGAGSAYSFRAATHRIARLSDVRFLNANELSVGGRLAVGIIADLGNVGIETLTANSPGVRELREFVPAGKAEEIAAQSAKLNDGYTVNKIRFGSRAPIRESSTYVLRSIAYRSKFMTTLPGSGITYDEFEFDNRKDILVAARIVKINDDGSLVLLWKKLEEKESPKIKVKKDSKDNS